MKVQIPILDLVNVGTRHTSLVMTLLQEYGITFLRQEHVQKRCIILNMQSVPVSIIIPTLNEEDYLPHLLDSLKKISSPLDIIVVDGNSIDATCAIVERYSSHFNNDSSLRLLRTQERCISIQRNIGAREAQHEILLFCDADVLAPHHDMHQDMITEFIEKKYTVAGPRMHPIEYRWDIVLFTKTALCIQKIFHWSGKSCFAGAYLITTKSLFDSIGGFDESIKLAEDVDFSIRAGAFGQWVFLGIL